MNNGGAMPLRSWSVVTRRGCASYRPRISACLGTEIGCGEQVRLQRQKTLGKNIKMKIDPD